MDGKACANGGSSLMDDIRGQGGAEELADHRYRPGRLNWMASVTLH